MATPLATKEAVYEACARLASEGLKPTLLLVRERIGGGSYTTVQRHLDAWVSEQAQTAAADPMPAEVTAIAEQATQNIWAAASRLAQGQAHAIREAAQNKVAEISDDLDIARKEIERLEGVAAQADERARQLDARLQAAESALVEARITASKCEDLQLRLSASEGALAESREIARAASVDAARQAGELDALRAQVTTLTQALGGKANPN